MISAIYLLWAKLFGRPIFRKANSFLFHLSLRGLGVGNYQSGSLSGERWFIQKFLPRHLSTTPKPLFIDAGANEGDYAQLLRDQFPNARIVCFEPSPTTLKKLHSRVSALKIEVVAHGLGESPGPATLYDYVGDNAGSQHASLFKEVIEKQHRGSSAGVPVQLTTLDNFCREHAIDRIDFLKIDVEGNEFACLQGARGLIARRAIGVIQFEFNQMNVISRVTMNDFDKLLAGYDLFRLLPSGLLRLNLRDTAQSTLFMFQNVVALPNSLRACDH